MVIRTKLLALRALFCETKLCSVKRRLIEKVALVFLVMFLLKMTSQLFLRMYKIT